LQKEQSTELSKSCVVCSGTYQGDITVCPNDGSPLTSFVVDKKEGDIIAEKYQILEVLGAGGMGKVYKAKHLLMNRTVAIKTLLPQAVSNALALKRFQQEAQACSALNHPNLMTVYDFGITPEGLPYLVMDFLEGISLADALPDSGHMPTRRSLPIFMQIAMGLAHAHEHGVIHRDLKPANIMLVDYDGTTDFVKIVDFGIAKIIKEDDDVNVEHLTQTGEVFGSPLYMSPEQCRGKTLDARSDIYSFGCVMFRTLTGKAPFGGSDRLEAMFNQINQEAPKLSEVSPELTVTPEIECVVVKCLAKDANDRYQSMAEILDDLEKLPEFDYMVGRYPSTSVRASQLRIPAMPPVATDPASISGTDKLPALKDAIEKSAGNTTSPQTPAESAPAISLTPGTTASISIASATGTVSSSSLTTAPSLPKEQMPKNMRTIVISAVVAFVALAAFMSYMYYARNDKNAAKIFAAIDGGQTPKEASVDAQTLFEKGKYTEAETRARKALDEATKTKDTQGVFASSAELGHIYLHEFKYAEAQQYFTYIFEAKQKKLPVSDKDFSRALNGLGMIATLQGDYTRAKAYLDSAQDLRKNFKGRDRVFLARTIAAKGNLARAQKKYPEAIALLTQAKDMSIAAVGMDNSETYDILNDLGQAYQFARKNGAAEECYKTALDGRKRILTPDSPGIAESLMCLAALRRDQNKIGEAIQLFEQAQTIEKQAFGSDSGIVADLGFVIGGLYERQKQFVKAEAYYSQSLAIRRAKLPAGDPKIRESEKKDAEMKRKLKG
jgi:serine/threonine protein kinase/tetratricopeptide (TPR) repeat protein